MPSSKESKKQPVTLKDFDGQWSVWSVMPFDSTTPPHKLPVQFGDTIHITTSEPGYRPPNESQQCQSAAAILKLTNTDSTASSPESDISVLNYVSESAELSGAVVQNICDDEDEFVFNIKHIGEITEEMLKDVRQGAGNEQKLKMIDKQIDHLRKISARNFSQRALSAKNGLRVRDLLLIWTNRFKHPGGYAHVHESN